MALTKEECQKALNSVIECIQMSDCRNCDYYMHRRCLNGNKDFDIMKQLIKEHFDNPPLKFEELALYTPCWDSGEDSWCYFSTLNKDKNTGVKISIREVSMIGAFVFEDNRFYRREVHDE